jgi:hypothetical protein
MKNHILIFTLSILVSACGGSSSSSDTAPETQTPEINKLTLNNTNTSITFAKQGDGEWSSLAAGNHTISALEDSQKLQLVTICDNHSYVDVIKLTSDRIVDYSWCNNSNGTRRVTIASADETTILHSLLSETTEESSDYAQLSSSSVPRTIIAVGYNSTTKKAYFYKKEGLDLKDGDSIDINFADTDLASETPIITNPIKSGFEFNADYRLNSSASEIPLSIYLKDGYPYIEVPNKFRTADDYYRSNWQFGTDSSYDVFAKEISLENELESAPNELSTDSVSFSQDEKQGMIEVVSNQSGLPLQRIELEFYKYNAGTNSVYINYTIDGSLLIGDSLNWDLVDFSLLPSGAPEVIHPALSDLDYYTEYYSSSEIGKTTIGTKKLIVTTPN